MLFSSTIFIFFFLPVVLFVYYVCLKRTRPRNIFLLLASLFFYAWGEPWFVLVMILSIIVNYYFGLLVDKYRNYPERLGLPPLGSPRPVVETPTGGDGGIATLEVVEETVEVFDDLAQRNAKNLRLVMTLMVVFNLALIFVFKYLMFMLHNINSLFGTRIDIPTIILPIGISFFTFHSISYVMDIHRGKAQALRNPLDVGLYISLFSQLVAGPIVRYETIAEQLAHRKENFSDFSTGACRFILGLAKKVLIANNMALVADAAFAKSGGDLSVSFAWLGIIAYTFQIFFDFSGYSDMAIGLGKMFGFHFLENFNYPYIAKSVTEFWRRWHISLSSWFRDYVYFPLGGSRVKTKLRLIMNLLIVWLLTGIWHGANWTFVCWGLFYFVLLVVEKFTGYADKAKEPSRWAIFGHVYLLLAAMLGWVLFRSLTITDAASYVMTMFGAGARPFIDDMTRLYLQENLYFFIGAVIFSMPVAEWLGKKTANSRLAGALYPVVLMFLFVICVTYIIKGTYNPFIYFNF